MASILQGTTPTLTFTVTDAEGNLLDLTDVAEVEVTVAQKGVAALVAHGYAAEIDTATSTVSYTLTESQTLALRPDRKTLAQLRFKATNGSIFGVPAVAFDTLDLLSDVAFGEEA